MISIIFERILITKSITVNTKKKKEIAYKFNKIIRSTIGSLFDIEFHKIAVLLNKKFSLCGI